MERGLADDSIFESMPDWCKLPPSHERHHRGASTTLTTTTDLSYFHGPESALVRSSSGNRFLTFEWDSLVAKKSYEKLLI